MHPAPDTYDLLSKKVRNSIKDSDVLWVEVDLTNKENINKLEKSYYLESGKTVKDYLSKEYIYVNGDVESANEYEYKMMETYDDETYEILIKDRNIKIVEKIKANMTDGKKHTLAVGYRHFMGKDSIIKLLELEGYTVKKL